MFKNIISLQTYITLLIITWFCSSCAPTYLPNAVHTPLLYEKGEFEANLHTGLNMVDAQIATAITGNGKGGIALMGNVSYTNTSQKDEAGEETNSINHVYGEGGVGYYYNLGEAGVLEVYTGFGAGKGSAKETFTIGSTRNVDEDEGTYQRFFLQTNIGATTRFIEGGLGVRGSYVNFSEFTSNDPLTGNNRALFLEPTLFMRIGGGGLDKRKPNIKVSMQLGLNAPLTKEFDFDTEPINFNIGVSFRLGRSYLRERIRDIRR